MLGKRDMGQLSHLMDISSFSIMGITIRLLKFTELQTLQRWLSLCKLHVNTTVNICSFEEETVDIQDRHCD